MPKVDDRWNDLFHNLYEQSSNRARATLGTAKQPVVFRLEDDLHLLFEGEETARGVRSETYQAVKVLSHVAPAIFLAQVAMAEGEETPLDLGALRARLDKIELPSNLKHIGEKYLAACVEALESVDGDGRMTHLALRAYREAIHPLYQDMFDICAREELSGIRSVIREFEKIVDDQERWRCTYFVVCAGHQPRYKELTKQFLTRYLQDRAAMPGGYRHQLIYAEGATSKGEVLDLIATRMVDRHLSEAFFGGSLGMQEDVLGEAAARALNASGEQEP